MVAILRECNICTTTMSQNISERIKGRLAHQPTVPKSQHSFFGNINTFHVSCRISSHVLYLSHASSSPFRIIDEFMSINHHTKRDELCINTNFYELMWIIMNLFMKQFELLWIFLWNVVKPNIGENDLQPMVTNNDECINVLK